MKYEPLPPGVLADAKQDVIHHVCRDPRCVNPAHLKVRAGRPNRRRAKAHFDREQWDSFECLDFEKMLDEAEKRGREQGREDAHLSDAWHEMQDALKYLKLVPMREDETETEKETFQWLHHHLLTAIGNIEILMGFAEDEKTPGSQNVT